MRYLKLTSDHKNEELTTIAPQKPFEILTTTPDIILCIAEFLPSSEKWFGYRLVNHRTREIFQDIFENHVRHCILNQCETTLLQCQRTLMEKLGFYLTRPFGVKPFIADVYRINFIVYDDHQHIVSNTVQENIPFGAAHQTVNNKELLQAMFRQISSNALSSHSNRKIPLMCMQLLAEKYNILGTIVVITACAGIALITIVNAISRSKISAATVVTGGIIAGCILLVLSTILGIYVCTKMDTRIGNYLFRLQKNSQNALAANTIKNGRIAVGQHNDSDLRNISFDLYIPKNTLTFFQSKDNGALAITPDTRVVEIPETPPEREPGANGSAVGANEASSLLLYQQLK